MKKRFWRIEYSLTIIVIFATALMLVPTQFIASKEASLITKWNDTYHKIEYVFNAMAAQADAEIIKSFKRAKTNEARENLMKNLVKPYLRITEDDTVTKKYTPHYMKGTKVLPNDPYYFEKLYLSKNGKLMGIKDIKDDDIFHPAFIMMFDMNGLKGPNTWGKDIFGINIFNDGKITPIGAGWDIEELKQDCSASGTGVSCSYYYRIGGDFNE
ncbi:hypothetical protein IJ472_06630 [bacterium]|nr:hypothetical protein [bacterium]